MKRDSIVYPILLAIGAIFFGVLWYFILQLDWAVFEP